MLLGWFGGALLLVAMGVVILSVVVTGTLSKHQRRRRNQGKSNQRQSLAFFHPFAHCGGGGERVLWTAIQGLQQDPAHRPVQIIIYIASEAKLSTFVGGRSASEEAITLALIDLVKSQFNITIDPTGISFVYLDSVAWLRASRYPRLTLIAQSLGSLVTAWEALSKYCPDVFIDTTGFAFSYPLAKYVFDCHVIAYTHYPTISTDMLAKIKDGKSDFNNESLIAKSFILSTVKQLYYLAFAQLYSIVGRCATVVMVNSTWTRNHIDSLWQMPGSTHIVYPPCDTKTLTTFPLDRTPSSPSAERLIISIAQFRPEKAHSVQVEAFADVLRHFPTAKMVLIGGCRDSSDQQRVDKLHDLITSLGILDNVTIVQNANSAVLNEYLRNAEIGLHTMHNEHFGIVIIEYMAAGVIPIANDSGGPKADIVVPFHGQETGYLCSTKEEYARAMVVALSKSAKEALRQRETARALIEEKFSGKKFCEQFNKYTLG